MTKFNRYTWLSLAVSIVLYLLVLPLPTWRYYAVGACASVLYPLGTLAVVHHQKVNP